MEMIEKTAETIEAAIEAGLKELGVSSAEVMIEVLEEPSRGIMGIGAKPARVRIIFMGTRATPPVAPPKAPQKEQSSRNAKPSKNVARDSREPRDTSREGKEGRNAKRNPRDRRSEGRKPAPARPQAEDYDIALDDAFDLEEAPQAVIIPDDQASDIARAGKQMLLELLQKMSLPEATVTIHKAENAQSAEESHWILNVSGKGVTALIGKRGETLSSLQYVMRMMLSRRVQQRSNIIVDVGEYKLRRSERLRAMANRLADQAVQTGRVVTLEPMPPNERRIIHLTLRERVDVQTKSVGEGNARKVTIHPKASE